MRNSALNPTAIHCLGTASMLALTTALFFAVVQPMWHEQRERSGVERDLADQRVAIDRQERLRRGMTVQLAQAIDSADQSALPLKDPRALNEELAALSDLAARSGVQIDALRPGTATSNGKVQALPIQLSGHGGYRAVHSFMESLRKQMSDTSVRDFTFTADNSSAAANASVNMQLVWLTRGDRPITSTPNK
jgi:hypothetical protein